MKGQTVYRMVICEDGSAKAYIHKDFNMYVPNSTLWPYV